MSFKFGKHKLNVLLQNYQNGNLCLTCVLTNGEEWIRLSTNLENESPESDNIFIKENDESYTGLADTMVKLGLLQEMEDERATSGYNSYKLYRVLPKCFEMAKKNN